MKRLRSEPVTAVLAEIAGLVLHAAYGGVLPLGGWSWEPRRSRAGETVLPVDARIVRIRRPEGRERNRLHYRLLVMECTSADGDVRLAVEPGRLEHVVMKLAPAGHEVLRPVVE
jgi:hypothetical protein